MVGREARREVGAVAGRKVDKCLATWERDRCAASIFNRTGAHMWAV